jgi:hypothetical protein
MRSPGSFHQQLYSIPDQGPAIRESQQEAVGVTRWQIFDEKVLPIR